MWLLRYKLNYRNIVIDENSTGEVVPVRRRNGEFSYHRWLGLIDVTDAKALNSIKPVTIGIDAFAEFKDVSPVWIAVKESHWLQGVKAVDGVYGCRHDNQLLIVHDDSDN